MIKEIYNKIITNYLIYFVFSMLFFIFTVTDFIKIKDTSLSSFLSILILMGWIIFSLVFAYLLYQNIKKFENKFIAKVIPLDIFNTKLDNNFLLNLIKNYYKKNKENIEKIKEKNIELENFKNYLNENNKLLNETFKNVSDKLNFLQDNNFETKNYLNQINDIFNDNLKIIIEMEEIIKNNLKNKIINVEENIVLNKELNNIKEININNILLLLTLISTEDINLKRKIIKNLDNNIKNINILINNIITNYELKLNNLKNINNEYQNIINQINNKLYIIKEKSTKIENILDKIFELIEKNNKLIKETKDLINKQMGDNQSFIKKYQLDSFLNKNKNKISLNI